MAQGITTPADFVIYNEWVQSGYLERIAENVQGFNANSNGGIVLTTASLLGNYKETAFFKELAQADLIHDRDKNSTTAVTAAKMEAVEEVIPYLPSRFGPYETTRSAFLDIGKSPTEFSSLLGQALADAVMKDMLDTSFAAAISAVKAHVPGYVVGDKTKGLTYNGFIDGMAAYGDKLDNIAVFVMRSKDYFSVMRDNVTAATIDTIAGQTLREGSVATLGKPVLVMDNDKLLSGTDGAVLALAKGAITCIADDNMYITTKEDLMKENITITWQGEGQYGLKLLGYGYDKTKSISRTEIVKGSNWSKTVTSDKNTGIVVVETKA